MFWPVDSARYLIVVAPDDEDGSPNTAQAQAFLAGPDRGVIYAPGVWHLPLVALDAPAVFIMRMFESGTPDDCEEHALKDALSISF
jgi:ureidoglycolate lyase